MVPFGGWDMPVQYTGIIDEHRTVRGAVGLFDISHMGEFEVRGADALAAVQRLCTNDAAHRSRSARSSTRCSATRRAASSTTSPSTASPTTLHAVGQRVQHRQGLGVGHRPTATGAPSGRTSATRPRCSRCRARRREALVGRLADRDVTGIGYYHFARGTVAGVPALDLAHRLHRRGRLRALLPRRPTPSALWGALLEAGRADGVKPIGLGARDTLRLEMRLRALRQRHRRDHQPARGRARLGGQARQGRVHRARRASRRCARAGLARKLVGLRDGRARGAAPRLPPARGRRAGRRGHLRARSARRSSESIGMGYVPAPHGRGGHRARGRDPRPRRTRPRVVKTPFHSPSHTETRLAEETSMANDSGGAPVHREHEWAKVEGDRARVGITAFAQEQLGDVVFVELPKVGAQVTAMQDLRRGRVGEGGLATCSPRSPARWSRSTPSCAQEARAGEQRSLRRRAGCS